MARKKKQTSETIRTRRPARTVDGSFRRNNVVVSRAQKEVARHQRSVTQRQVEKQHMQQHRKRRRKLVVGLIVVLVLIFCYLSAISDASISSSATNQLSTDQKAVYESALRKTYYEHTIAQQSWLSDKSAAKTEFLKEYPEVEDVTLKTQSPFSKTLKAEVRFRKPVFTWKDISGTQQFVDNNGVLFSRNMDKSVKVDSLIQIEDQSGVALQVGTSVLTENLIAFVGQLHTTVPKVFGAGKEITNVIIPRSTREVQIKVSDTPYLIKLNSFRDIDQQVGELKGLIAYLESQQIIPQQYIDLRVEHKAFYK